MFMNVAKMKWTVLLYSIVLYLLAKRSAIQHELRKGQVKSTIHLKFMNQITCSKKMRNKVMNIALCLLVNWKGTTANSIYN
jgi:hypothetical protein